MEVLPWQAAIASALRSAGVDTVAYVPDSRLTGVVAALGGADGPLIRSLTREEECVGYATGAGAAGRRAAILMQCSGLGNSINALASFTIPYAIGVPMVLSMRGTLGESNPSQIGMGRATPGLLAALGIQGFLADRPEDVPALAAGVCTLAYDTGAPAALLLGPGLGGQREAR
jgi:sulfopyruvate decarboxylase subunit alpha